LEYEAEIAEADATAGIYLDNFEPERGETL
jgi:hypothetical protein